MNNLDKKQEELNKMVSIKIVKEEEIPDNDIDAVQELSESIRQRKIKRIYDGEPHKNVISDNKGELKNKKLISKYESKSIDVSGLNEFMPFKKLKKLLKLRKNATKK